jgi:hypothetical protein
MFAATAATPKKFLDPFIKTAVMRLLSPLVLNPR